MKKIMVVLVSMALGAAGNAMAQTTGFNKQTAGPWDYDDTANWVDGTINGIWDSSLVLSFTPTNVPQVVTFDSDYVLGTGLTFNYTGNFALTLRGDGTNRTITLGGNISVAPASNQTVTIGSGTAGQNLNVDLGGASRTMTVNAGKTLVFTNIVSNGSIVKSGDGTLTLAGANTFAGGLTLDAGTLNMNNNAALGTGALTINGGTLNVNGARTTTNVQNWNGDFTFTGGNTWNTGTAAITLGGSRQVTIGGSTMTVGGAIGESGSGYSLTKSGAGTLVLNGANTYSGGTTVNGGTLTVGAAGTLGSNTVGNNVNVNGAILNLAAATNIEANQTLSIGSTSSSLGVLGLAFNSLPSFTQTGADSIVIGVNTVGFTAITDQSTVGNGKNYLGSTGTGTYAGATLGAGSDGVYRLGGGGGTLTVTNGVLSGSGDLLVGSSLSNGGGTVILNGTNSLSGDTTVTASTLRLNGADGSLASSDITVVDGTLNLNSSTAGVTGTTRAASVSLRGGTLSLNGNGTSNSSETISNGIHIDGKSALAGIGYITLSPSGNTDVQLNATTLTRSNGGIVQISGTNLGSAPSGSTPNSYFVLSGTVPTLVGGGGGATSTTMSILPWAIGGATANSATSFITYDGGFRPLTAGEYATSLADGTTSANNVKITATGATNVILTNTTTVNSLYLAAGGSGSGINISGSTLAVTSGAVFLSNPDGGITVASHLDFGSAQGVIGYSKGKPTSITGGLSGSGGVVFYQAAAAPTGDSGGTGLTLGGTNDYTGDTYILGRLTVGNNVLPNGSRMGDIYNEGILDLNGNILTINGLNGGGILRDVSSGTGVLTLGDNDANGEYSGTITENAALGMTKIGSGTQKMTGSFSITGATIIRGGVLEVSSLANGGIASSIGSSSNASTNLIVNGGTLRYSGGGASSDRLFRVGETTTGAVGTIDASGTGELNFTNAGALTYGTAGTTGAAQTRTLVLTGTNIGDNTLAATIGNNGAATNGNSDVSLTKNGTGKWILTGANTYTGATMVNGGTLIVNGSLSGTSSVTVATGARLGGSGIINATVGGSGSIDPGNSPGLQTYTQVDTSAGLDFNFEFTLANSLPDFDSTENDILRLTNISNPITDAFTAGNVMTLYIDVASLNDGDIFTGGFYTDGGDFISYINGGSIVAYIEDAGGAITYMDKTYSLVTSGSFSVSTLANTEFTAEGYLTQFTYTAVPEPSTYMLVALGVGSLYLLRRRRA